jgi:hypothetical protein
MIKRFSKSRKGKEFFVPTKKGEFLGKLNRDWRKGTCGKIERGYREWKGTK